MRCGSCGRENDKGASFCFSCGKKILQSEKARSDTVNTANRNEEKFGYQRKPDIPAVNIVLPSGRGRYIASYLTTVDYKPYHCFVLVKTVNDSGKPGNTYVGGFVGYGESDSDNSSLITYSSTAPVSGSSNANQTFGYVKKIKLH